MVMVMEVCWDGWGVGDGRGRWGWGWRGFNGVPFTTVSKWW